MVYRIYSCEYMSVSIKRCIVIILFLGEFKRFENGRKITDDVIVVRCYTKNTTIYEYVHYIVHRINKNKAESKYKERMNVLVIGLDSVSSSSFQRSLPKTLNFLRSFNNFYHFKKYHSTGVGSVHNLAPFLSGRSLFY